MSALGSASSGDSSTSDAASMSNPTSTTDSTSPRDTAPTSDAASPSARPTGFEPGTYADLSRDVINPAIDAALASAHITDVNPSQIDIAQIWAQTTAGVIGDGKDMPWYLPEDLKHFQQSTKGYPVVMGRTSWEALEDPYRPLPDRENWVVTRDAHYRAPGGHVTTDLVQGIAQAAVWAVRNSTETAGRFTVWILGGGQVYAQCMPICDRLVITEIEMVAPERFTVHAPIVPEDQFSLTASDWATSLKGHTVDGRGSLRYRICTWIRNS